ncbi:hypothetical protein ACFQIA_23735 [Halalkalicoccus sp. GCM10025704]
MEHMDVPELTREGHRFIEDLLEIYKETHGSKHSTIGKLATLKQSDSGGVMPVEHPNYGELVTDSSKEYYLKARYPETWDDLPPNHRREPTYESDKPDGGCYTNECFGEARVWLEAKERGKEHMDLFAPVVDYDGEEFRWIVMLKCDYGAPIMIQLPTAELGWVSEDTETGLLDGQKVAYDYGMWKRKNDEWLVPEEDVFKDNPVFF